MSKVLTILALSLGVATAANAGSSRPHYTYASVNRQSQTSQTVTTNATSEAVTAAPEIDPAGALSAFTLLIGGLAVVRGRRVALKAQLRK